MPTIIDHSGMVHKVTGIISDKTNVRIVHTACGKSVQGNDSELSITCAMCTIAIAQASLDRLGRKLT